MSSLEKRPGVMVVASPENRRYLTGFTGSSGAAVFTQAKAFLVTDFRYLDQAAGECPGWEIVRQGPIMADTIAEILGRLGEDRVGFERELATFALYEDLAGRLKGFDFVPVGPIVERVREVKEDPEIDLIRQAAAITDQALGDVISLLRPGMPERQIALEIEYRMRKLGADDAAFPTIVASGARSALPHGRASEKLLASGDFVTIDAGAKFGGYCSDLTRTFVLSPLSADQEKLYALVLNTQLTSLEAVKPGRLGKEIDAVSREMITSAGHGEHYGHGLGHSLGLAVHETPRLSPVSDRVLEIGNVVTVEPGVYVSGWGGVRIEDLVVVRRDGPEVLSKFPKKLMVL
jgi:Xaa-Pro aminopeptidase